jgi:hypothetical protein
MTRGGKVFKPAHLRCDNPRTETEAKKESQVAEEDNEVIKQLKYSGLDRDSVFRMQSQTHVSLVREFPIDGKD